MLLQNLTPIHLVVVTAKYLLHTSVEKLSARPSVLQIAVISTISRPNGFFTSSNVDKSCEFSHEKMSKQQQDKRRPAPACFPN